MARKDKVIKKRKAGSPLEFRKRIAYLIYASWALYCFIRYVLMVEDQSSFLSTFLWTCIFYCLYMGLHGIVADIKARKAEKEQQKLEEEKMSIRR